MNNNLNENISLNYNFSLDNDLNSFEYNEFNTTISYKNFITNFNFIEENGEIETVIFLKIQFLIILMKIIS